MANVLVTGSAAGIGRECASVLVYFGHRVVLHARNADRAAEALAVLPGAAGVVVGDLASLAETHELAAGSDRLGPFDAVIHNAGIGGSSPERALTEDGIEEIFQVNVVAPYLLTCLMRPPGRLVYLSSGLQSRGKIRLEDLQHRYSSWDPMQVYSDSKLCDVALAFAVARLWPEVLSNAVDPGWIRTRMGGVGATGDVAQGADSPVWLATSDEPAALVTGKFFHERRELRALPAAYDHGLQDGLLEACAKITGVELPR